MYERMDAFAIKLEQVRLAQEALTAELHAIIQDSYAEGISVTFIARKLGVSRQTIYNHLEWP